MDTMTLDAKRIQLAQYILALQDVSMIERIDRMLSSRIDAEPCHYSLEEVEERLCVQEQDALAGNGVSFADIEKESKTFTI